MGSEGLNQDWGEGVPEGPGSGVWAAWPSSEATVTRAGRSQGKGGLHGGKAVVRARQVFGPGSLPPPRLQVRTGWEAGLLAADAGKVGSSICLHCLGQNRLQGLMTVR